MQCTLLHGMLARPAADVVPVLYFNAHCTCSLLMLFRTNSSCACGEGGGRQAAGSVQQGGGMSRHAHCWWSFLALRILGRRC